MSVTHLDHVAIATPDLDIGSTPYLALGLHPEGPDEDVNGQGVRVRAFMVGETLIELLMPTRPDSPIAAYLEKRGPGLHHTAYRVADLDAEMTRLRAEGARFLSDAPAPGRAGTRVAFLHPKWGAGTLIELVEHLRGQAGFDGTGV
ncbi:VOC family protein [Deinococcus humi]|uniref:Methylmalonyl-CoA/ethylmalonyl-CoA epimerase n=1 Tax=Deinococcus humi TaxID=662880 RepID=A0A7W8JQ17_9DEIO|nr:VOC family protein [Deinococcus humi]MBB5361122.1 methylmalonyl-CoA/ethylmalonyl-CoA epimerase [Deinococcus humi]GGO18532.1 methylmalonyl-CoA epimerase [Deinococcus humi]